MRVCDVVLDSIWYDPRVRKQINSYIENGVELSCVGYKCERYDAEKVASIPCPTTIVEDDARYAGKQHSLLKKLQREKTRNDRIANAIIKYNPEVIHANDLNALIPSVKAAKKLKCVLVYDSHEICVENIYVGGLYKKYLAWSEKRCIKKIDKMICVSNAAAKYFKDKYKIKKPMVVTNCSLKSEQYISEEKNEGFEILNHGQFYEGRGYDVMVESIPLLKDYPEIKLAVRGFGKLEETLRTRSAELAGDNFIFYPKVLVQDLISFASRSKVGVAITEAICLNFELSVSNKLFEYASAGLPVIMSDIPEHRYLNDKYNFGIVIPENTPKAFAEAVIKLYSDKEFYKLCAKNAKILSDEVNWENEFGKLIAIEMDLLNKKNNHRQQIQSPIKSSAPPKNAHPNT